MQNTTDQSARSSKKIGIYGGAFNPVHNGHIKLARNFLNKLDLDAVYFVPTSNPPHRVSKWLAPEQDRLKMLELAVLFERRFKVCEFEFNRKGKSYTYYTVGEFRRMFPDASLYLIIGADQFFAFDSWYKACEILDAVTLCTAPRNGENEYSKLIAARNTMPVFRGRSVYIDDFMPCVISSHEIRDMIKSGKSISRFVDPAVEQYIKEKGVYSV